MHRWTHHDKKTAARETFDEFLAKDGILAETEDAAVKEIIADQIRITMERPEQN
jgi:hypothetical protein